MKRFLSIMLISIALVACKSGSEGDAADPGSDKTKTPYTENSDDYPELGLGKGIYIPFDTESKFKITLGHAENNTLQLFCVTDKQYNYADYVIIFKCSQSSSDIDIMFYGAFQAELGPDEGRLCVCGPAKETINLKGLDFGTYRLNLSVGEETYSGKLIVSAGGFTSDISYTIYMEENPVFEIENLIY